MATYPSSLSSNGSGGFGYGGVVPYYSDGFVGGSGSNPFTNGQETPEQVSCTIEAKVFPKDLIRDIHRLQDRRSSAGTSEVSYYSFSGDQTLSIVPGDLIVMPRTREEMDQMYGPGGYDADMMVEIPSALTAFGGRRVFNKPGEGKETVLKYNKFMGISRLDILFDLSIEQRLLSVARKGVLNWVNYSTEIVDALTPLTCCVYTSKLYETNQQGRYQKRAKPMIDPKVIFWPATLGARNPMAAAVPGAPGTKASTKKKKPSEKEKMAEEEEEEEKEKEEDKTPSPAEPPTTPVASTSAAKPSEITVAVKNFLTDHPKYDHPPLTAEQTEINDFIEQLSRSIKVDNSDFTVLGKVADHLRVPAILTFGEVATSTTAGASTSASAAATAEYPGMYSTRIVGQGDEIIGFNAGKAVGPGETGQVILL